MTESSQRRAVANHRRRLAEQGMSRYEVRGRVEDKPLLRALAKRLAAGDTAAARLRATLAEVVGGNGKQAGGILAALRRSPLVGADLAVDREVGSGRDVEL
jgi:hypothetical protein